MFELLNLFFSFHIHLLIFHFELKLLQKLSFAICPFSFSFKLKLVIYEILFNPLNHFSKSLMKEHAYTIIFPPLLENIGCDFSFSIPKVFLETAMARMFLVIKSLSDILTFTILTWFMLGIFMIRRCLCYFSTFLSLIFVWRIRQLFITTTPFFLFRFAPLLIILISTLFHQMLVLKFYLIVI